MPKERQKKVAQSAGARPQAKGKNTNGNGANVGFEAQLFLAADKLRKNLEPSDHKHVALSLIFLNHISNAFEAKHAALLAEDPAASEDPDEYLAENVFWVPKEARWSHLQANAKQPTIRGNGQPFPETGEVTECACQIEHSATLMRSPTVDIIDVAPPWLLVKAHSETAQLTVPKKRTYPAADLESALHCMLKQMRSSIGPKKPSRNKKRAPLNQKERMRPA